MIRRAFLPGVRVLWQGRTALPLCVFVGRCLFYSLEASCDENVPFVEF
jgi:hypothetical protein